MSSVIRVLLRHRTVQIQRQVTIIDRLSINHDSTPSSRFKILHDCR